MMGRNLGSTDEEMGSVDIKFTHDGVLIPSRAVLQQRKLERLRDKCFAVSGDYIALATMRQMEGFVEKDDMFPANAVNLVNNRAEVLRRNGFPVELLRVGRSDLPVSTADQDLDYSPLDYLATVYPGAQMFPLRAFQKIQRSQAVAQLRASDPIELREMYRKGLVQILTRLSPNSPDVKSLRGVSSPYDLMELIEAAVAVAGDCKKEQLFCKVVRARLRKKADSYDEQVREMTEGQERSNTGQELYELTDETNLRFLIGRFNAVAGSWVATRPKKAPVTSLNSNLGFYLEWFSRDPFWFAGLSSSELERCIADFNKVLNEEMDTMVFTSPVANVRTFARRLGGSKRDASWLSAYLDCPIEKLCDEVINKHVDELLSDSEVMLRDALGSGNMIKFVDDFCKLFADAVTEVMNKIRAGAKKTPDAEVQDENPDDNLAEVIQLFPSQALGNVATLVKPKNDVLANLKRLTDLQTGITWGFSADQKGRFKMLYWKIAQKYVDQLLLAGGSFSMRDLYGFYRGKSLKLYPLFDLLRKVYGDEDAKEVIYRLLDARLCEIPEETFCAIYNSIYAGTAQGAPIAQFIFRDYNCLLPAARARLIDIIENRPQNLHARWSNSWANFKKLMTKTET